METFQILLLLYDKYSPAWFRIKEKIRRLERLQQRKGLNS
jgi:hypothetical protein